MKQLLRQLVGVIDFALLAYMALAWFLRLPGYLWMTAHLLPAVLIFIVLCLVLAWAAE